MPDGVLHKRLQAQNGTATGSTSGAIRKVTRSSSPNRARCNSKYRSIDRNSSAKVVKSPCRRNEYRVNPANSSSNSRALSGSDRTNDAIVVSEL